MCNFDWCVVLMLLFLPVAVADEPDSMSPVNFSDVTISSEFWSPRQETNRRVSIPHNLETCEETGRIDNFRHVSGDHSIPRMTWWSRRGSKERVSLEFDKPHTFSQAEVY